MPITAVEDWSETALDNTDLNSIPLEENMMYPQHVNNAFRELMAQLATYFAVKPDTSGTRNKIINGNFDIWQRGTTFSGYSSRTYAADRWAGAPVALANGTITRQTVGASIKGDPIYYLRLVPSGSNTLTQRIESVRTLAGKRATLTAYVASDAAATVTMNAKQSFGTGGSPSTDVTTSVGSQAVVAIPTWTKVQVVFDVPSISGKTIGSDGNDYLEISFGVGGTRHLNITHVSLVEGDASAEDDPFAERHPQQELALCQRYFEASPADGILFQGATVSGGVYGALVSFKVSKRTTPTVSFANGTASNFATTSPTAIAQTESFYAVKTASGAGNTSYWSHSWTATAEL